MRLLSAGGGVFRGGNYWSSFQLDVRRIPADGSATQFPLTSFDVFTTGAINVEFSPALFASGAELIVNAPVGECHGGLVLSTTESNVVGADATFQRDNAGTALVLDQAVIAPEPAGALLMGAGLGGLIAGRCRLRFR